MELSRKFIKSIELKSFFSTLTIIFNFSFISLYSQFNIQGQGQLLPDEIEEIEECFGWEIIKLNIQVDGKGRILRGYKPRYFSQIKMEFNALSETYNFSIINNSNPAINVKKFEDCLVETVANLKQNGNYIIEIEFHKDIWRQNRMVEIEIEMQFIVNEFIDNFMEPDAYFFSRYELEAEYLRSATDEILTVIASDFKISSDLIMKENLNEINQDSLTKNQLQFANYKLTMDNFNAELEELLLDIVKKKQKND